MIRRKILLSVEKANDEDPEKFWTWVIGNEIFKYSRFFLGNELSLRLILWIVSSSTHSSDFTEETRYVGTRFTLALRRPTL